MCGGGKGLRQVLNNQPNEKEIHFQPLTHGVWKQRAILNRKITLPAGV